VRGRGWGWGGFVEGVAGLLVGWLKGWQKGGLEGWAPRCCRCSCWLGKDIVSGAPLTHNCLNDIIDMLNSPSPSPAPAPPCFVTTVNGLKAAKAARCFAVAVATSLPGHMLEPYADLVLTHLRDLDLAGVQPPAQQAPPQPVAAS